MVHEAAGRICATLSLVMIRRTPQLEEFYRQLVAAEDLSHEEALRIFEALYAEAVSLGAIREENILDGLEVDLRVARAVNGLNRDNHSDPTNS
jgi:hypothetical protein